MSRIVQYSPVIEKKYIRSVTKQLKSGWLGPGETTKKVEEELCKMTGNKYCVATTSGTSALIMAILSLNIPKDKIILLPAYTFIAPHNAAKFLGYKIRLIDVDPNTMCMDYGELLKIYSKHKNSIGAIIFVNHNSYAEGEYSKIVDFCNRYSTPIISDASQALGNIKAFKGTVSVISFSVPKIATCGQGGAVVTNDENIYLELKKIQDHGDDWRKDRIHKNLGVNFKFNDILASYLLPQLKDINKLIFKRDMIFSWYQIYLKKNIVTYGMDSTWMVIYKTKKIQQIIKELEENNIQSVQYYKPISWNPPYYTSELFVNSEKIYQEYLYLPSSLSLTKNQIKRICRIILKIENGQKN